MLPGAAGAGLTVWCQPCSPGIRSSPTLGLSACHGAKSIADPLLNNFHFLCQLLNTHIPFSLPCAVHSTVSTSVGKDMA